MLTIIYCIVGILVFLVVAYLLFKLAFEDEDEDSWDMMAGFSAFLFLLAAAVGGLLWPFVVGVGGLGFGSYYLGKLFFHWKDKRN
jgi:uncharacterized membrane protein YbhN (UPF0104 family)